MIFFLKAQSQLNYLGLAEQADIRAAQAEWSQNGAYWPHSKIIENHLYVCTQYGLYRKDLATINDTLWEVCGFANLPLVNFIKKNDSILAATALIEDSLIVLSVDDGVSYTNHTSSFFHDQQNINRIWNLDVNPKNHHSLLVLHSHYGISRSIDYGLNWTNLYPWAGGYQERFVGFHDLDSNSIYYTGEQMFFESYIQVSNDYGNIWNLTGNIHNHATHTLTFHPTDTNIVFSGGEGLIGKSTDRGQTWSYVDTIPIYIYDIEYHPHNPNVMFATGDFHGINDTVEIYYSLNGGNDWNIFHRQQILNSDGAFELHIWNDKLLLFTLQNGVWMMDLDQELSIFPQNKRIPKIYPNPLNDNKLVIESVFKSTCVIMNSLGEVVHEGLLFPGKNEIELKVNSGFYRILIEGEVYPLTIVK